MKADVTPLKISKNNPTFRKKMWKLFVGIHTDSDDYVQEIKEYFMREVGGRLEYNERDDVVTLVINGHPPLRFKGEDYKERPQ